MGSPIYSNLVRSIFSLLRLYFIRAVLSRVPALKKIARDGHIRKVKDPFVLILHLFLVLWETHYFVPTLTGLLSSFYQMDKILLLDKCMPISSSVLLHIFFAFVGLASWNFLPVACLHYSQVIPNPIIINIMHIFS